MNSASPATATGPYWITDLGILPGGYDASWAFSLNNTGQVVEVSCDEETNTARGFIWDNGVMTDLGIWHEQLGSASQKPATK